MTAVAILEFFKQLFSNKYFWYVIVALFLIWLVNRYWDKIVAVFQPADIDLLPGETKSISKTRQAELKDFASELYQAIYATQNVGVDYREDKFIEAADLSDNELRFVSKHYRKSLTKGNWLFTDVDDETMPFSAVDENLMSRLAKVGEKG